MSKRLFFIVIITLISLSLTGWYYFTQEVKYFGTSAFQAIPGDAAAVIRIHNLKNYAAKSINNPIWKTFSRFPGVKAMYQKIAFADSLFRLYEEPGSLFKEKALTIVSENRDDLLRTLYLIELSSISERKALTALFEQSFAGKSFSREKLDAPDVELFTYSWAEAGENQSWSYTFFRGLFLAGSDRRMIIRAVYKLEDPLAQINPTFEKAGTKATEDADLNIYLNHQILPGFPQQLFSDTFWKQLNGPAPLAEWSSFDLSQKTDEMQLNGITFTGDPGQNRPAILAHQHPDSFQIARVFPAATTFFLGYVINDGWKFFNAVNAVAEPADTLNEHGKSLPEAGLLTDNNLQKIDTLNGISLMKADSLNGISLQEIDSLQGINLQEIVATHLNGAAAMVFTRPDPATEQENKYLVLSLRNGKKMEKAMLPMVADLSGSQNDEAKVYTLLQVNVENAIKIYKSRIPDFGKRVFGNIFGGVATNYFAVFDNHLILAESPVAVEQFIQADLSGQTLDRNPSYAQFTSGMSEKLNICAWSSPERSLSFLKELFNAEVCQALKGNDVDFKTIESAGWQFGIRNGMISNSARLKYSPSFSKDELSLNHKYPVERLLN